MTDALRAVLAATGFTATRPGVLAAAHVELATAEGVAPLLGARCLAGELATEGADVRARLERAYRATIAAGLLVEHESAPFLEALRRRGVPALRLKGAALARVAYGGDPGRRPMGDVDLLVPPGRWRDALDAVREVGATPDTRPLTARWDYAIPFRVGRGTRVDLHRYLCARPMFDVEYDVLFGTARELDGALVPGVPELFVTLAIHAAKHGFVLPMRSFVDGLALAATGALALDRVVALARRWRARRATAAWLATLAWLDGYRLDWLAAADEIGRDLDPWPRRIGRAGGRARDGSPHLAGARLYWRMARSLDSPARAVALLLERARLRIGNDLLSARRGGFRDG